MVGNICTSAVLMPLGIIMSDHQLDDSGGDQDGMPDPGETVTISVTLRNYVDSLMENVQGQLTVTEGNQWIQISDDTASFGNMSQYAEVTNSADPYVVNIDPGTPENTQITFSLLITAGGGYSSDAAFNMTVTSRYYQCPIMSWDLNTNPGWSTTGQWAFGQPTGQGGAYGEPDPTSGFTGTNVYGYNLNGDYSNSMSVQTLTLGPLDFTGIFDAELHFMRWLGVEQPLYDHAGIQVSTDGSNFTTIWENGSEITDSDWTAVNHSLGSTVSDQPAVYIRWTMGPTDSGWTYCGWNIDDVEICGYRIDGEPPTPTFTPVPTTTPVPSTTPVPTFTPVPTSTGTVLPTTTPPPPTNTPVPTNTPIPTFTPLPTGTGMPTHTPPPPPTHTPVPTTTSIPTHTPVPTTTPTGVMTHTPTFTPEPSDTPTMTPTGGAVETSTPTPEATSTPEPACTDLGVTIRMPDHHFSPGEACSLAVDICNPSDDVYDGIPLFVLLDVYGSYYFAPSFGQAFDHFTINVIPGMHQLEVLPEFAWPDNAGSASGILFHSAMTNPEMTELMGGMSTWSFGWSE